VLVLGCGGRGGCGFVRELWPRLWWWRCMVRAGR